MPPRYGSLALIGVVGSQACSDTISVEGIISEALE